MRNLAFFLGISVLSLSANAHAHFNLTDPAATAKSTEGGKGAPPCGPDTVSNTPIAKMGGSLLMIDVSETIPHAGFYRIALSLNSRSELPPDNVVKDAMGKVLTAKGGAFQNDSAEFQAAPVFPVLADHLWVHDGSAAKTFHTELVLPNVNCDKCTLQVIEFMQGHEYNDGGGFFYHHCADLKITADPSKPPFNPNGSGGAGGASAGGASGASGAAGASLGGAAGAAVGGAGGGSGGASGPGGSPGVSGGGASTSGAAGAPPGAAGASVSAAGASTAAGSASTPASDPGDSGGCSLSQRTSGSVPALSLLLGLFALGRRRRARG